jgi:hypothetical protein
MPLARENRIATRRTRRSRDESVLEQHAFTGESIEGRRLDDRISVRSRMGPTPIIGDAEQDVGAIGCTSGCAENDDKRDA